MRCNISDCIRYDTSVDSAQLQKDSQWKVQLTSTVLPSLTHTVNARKLVVATGLTSEPHLPNIPGMTSFRGLLLHSKQLLEKAANLLACKEVVVLGGNKSSWDVCYSSARAGAQVHMVIRPSGGGPSYLWPKSFTLGPFTLSLASMSSSRLFMLFDPTPFARSSLLRKFLHRTRVGGWICRLFWDQLDRRIKRLNGYDSHPELKKLEPWTTPFWMGNSASIHNYETDWFQLVREGKIRVHIADMDSVSEDHVQLSDGTIIKADALVCCTGWKSDATVRFERGEHPSNLLHSKSDGNVELEAIRAETQIHRDITYLCTLPRRTPNAPGLQPQARNVNAEPSELYRLVVPWQPELLDSKNVAFIGAHSSLHAVIVAQAQALWITAFFDGRIQHLQPHNVNYAAAEYDTILHSIYGQVRRPKETGGSGDKYPDLVFDSIPYVDTLLMDLGLETKRKDNWWRDILEAHKPRDYKDIVQKWMEKQR